MSSLAVIFLAKYLTYFLLLVLPFFWFRGHRLAVFKTVAAMIAAFAVSELLKHYFYLPRPFVAGGFAPLIPHEPDGSFPSSHLSSLAALTVLVYIQDKRWGVLVFLGALMVGLGRVWSGVHYWFDIAGGLLLGTLIALVANKVVTFFVNEY